MFIIIIHIIVYLALSNYSDHFYNYFNLLSFIVSLTKTTKKGLPIKQQLVEEVHKCIDEYPNIFVFWVQNMRNAKLKELRGKWKDSRYF